jgi:hypothetical protein
MTTTMCCPKCRHALLQRFALPPPASRCSNPNCLAIFDEHRRPTDNDPGPWPDEGEVAELVAKALDGSMHERSNGGSWGFKSGTRTHVK